MLTTNSYHVLGLDSNASQKDALRRSREMINRIKIDDCPEYETDIGCLQSERSEKTVKEALQKLQNPRKRIKEYFFWFQVVDEVDESAMAKLRDSGIEDAIDIWKASSDSNDSKGLLRKKNLAVLYMLALYKNNSESYIKNSLNLWNEVINSEKFWKSFSQIYKLSDEQTANQEIINEFKESVISELSDTYVYLQQIHKNDCLINYFQDIFNVRGQKVEKDILNPIYEKINNACEELERMDVSEDGILDADERKKIKGLVSNIQDDLNQLIDLGLYDDSQTKVIRDRVADALRVIVLDLHNNLSETDVALSILNISLQIVGTSGMEAKIKQEVKTLEGIKNNSKIVKPVDELMVARKFQKAYDLINSEKEIHKNNPDLQEYYKSQETLAISMIAIEKYKSANDKFKEHKGDFGKKEFTEAGDLLYANLHMFNFNEKGVNEIIDEINENVARINEKNLEQLDEYRNSFVEQSKQAFEGQMEESVFIVLIDCFIYRGLCDFLVKYRKKKGLVNNLYTIGWITVWIYGIGIIFFIAGWIVDNRD